MGNSQNINKEKEIYSIFLIHIKIAMNKAIIWEKIYNVEETFERVYKDFTLENNYEKEFSVSWYYNETKINFDSSKLKQFIKDNNLSNLSTLEITQEIIEEGDIKNNHIENIDYIAIPFFRPFNILIYDIKQKKALIKEYTEEIINNNQLNKLGMESVYCNGGNHLFIMGGIDDLSGENLGIFLDIDLINGNINNFTQIIPPKRNNSMTYIQEKVYIVGGNDEKCILYDMKNKKIDDFGKLNIKRFEPSLIRHSNYLYCFDAFKKYNDKYSLERIKLNDLSINWEIIYPKISPSLTNTIYNQKFFGIVEDNLYNFIFLGGIYNNYLEEKNDENFDKNIYCMKYNILKNIVENSDIPFKELSLTEKTLLPLDDDNSILLFKDNKITKLLKFSKINKNLDIEDLQIWHNKTKDNKKYKKNVVGLKSINYLGGLNFDMPGKKIINEIDNDYNNNFENNNLDNNNNNLENNNNKEILKNINITGQKDDNNFENINIINIENNNNIINREENENNELNACINEKNIANSSNQNEIINKAISINENNINNNINNKNEDPYINSIINKIKEPNINNIINQTEEATTNNIINNNNNNINKIIYEDNNNINNNNILENVNENEDTKNIDIKKQEESIQKKEKNYENFHKCVDVNIHTETDLNVKEPKNKPNINLNKKERLQILKKNFDYIREINY